VGLKKHANMYITTRTGRDGFQKEETEVMIPLSVIVNCAPCTSLTSLKNGRMLSAKVHCYTVHSGP
jgi:hypothetical protein